MGMTTLLCLLFYLQITSPILELNNEVKNSNIELTEKLSKSKLSLDPDKLSRMKQKRIAYLSKVQKRARNILSYENKTITNMINKYYEDEKITIEDFIPIVQVIDYQAEYDRIKKKFNRLGLYWDEKKNSLGLTSNTSSTKLRYELLMSLWTFEYIVNKAMKHRLKISRDWSKLFKYGRKKVSPIATKIELPRRYVLSNSNTLPYLTEFPVTITLEGDLGDIQKFFRSCEQKKSFMPITKIQIEKLRNEKWYTPSWMKVKIECIYFLLLDKNIILDYNKSTDDTKKIIRPPRGA